MLKEEIVIGETSYPCYSIQTIVVGSGAAGLNAAVSLFKNGQKDIAIVTEGCKMGTSRNTGSDKQTYYKMTTCGSEADSVRQMAETLYQGGSMDGDIALAEAALSVRSFYHLVDIGVPFPHNRGGEYVGYKTDHDPFKRGTSAGPLTSKYMTEALLREVELYQIPVFDGYQVLEILTEKADETRIRGLVTLNKKVEQQDEFVLFSAENIVYATGGEAGMYHTSVYPVSQTGGTGAAFRAGAAGKNLTESQYGLASIKFRWNVSGTYQQVIPRFVSTDQEGNDKREFLEDYFDDKKKLLSAIFLKGYQWPFDPRKIENMGSSIIDILVYHETVILGRRVFLDYLHNPKSADRNGTFDVSMLCGEAYEYLKNSGAFQERPIDRLSHMNPAAIKLYQSHGIDLNKEMLEIAVCAQHNNGGLSGNHWWESNIEHLFPVGEVNGSHGVYRPGGTALNAGQVGSLRAAQYIAYCYRDTPWTADELYKKCQEQIQEVLRFGSDAFVNSGELIDVKEERIDLGKRMSRYGAHIRSKGGAEKALLEIEKQLERIQGGKILNKRDLKHVFRIRDLLVSQKVYLHAILDYINTGGGSRGSYLVYHEDGVKPIPSLPEEFRYKLDDRKGTNRIQEVYYQDGECKVIWREARPIPEEDDWFENVWRDYLQGTIYE